METKIITFDLSSSCIGCVAAIIKDNAVVKILSCPIMPPKFNAKNLGYLNSKKKIKSGKREFNAFLRTKDEIISYKEKKKRDTEVRNAKNLFIMNYISIQIKNIIDTTNPDIVIAEKNEIFNGILTSVLLGEIMGILIGIVSPLNIEFIQYKVQDVRKPYNIPELTKEFVKGKTSEELMQIPYLTKRVIRDMMEKKYKINFLTDDESDACILLDYHLTKK